MANETTKRSKRHRRHRNHRSGTQQAQDNANFISSMQTWPSVIKKKQKKKELKEKSLLITRY